MISGSSDVPSLRPSTPLSGLTPRIVLCEEIGRNGREEVGVITREEDGVVIGRRLIVFDAIGERIEDKSVAWGDGDWARGFFWIHLEPHWVPPCFSLYLYYNTGRVKSQQGMTKYLFFFIFLSPEWQQIKWVRNFINAQHRRCKRLKHWRSRVGVEGDVSPFLFPGEV